MRQAISTLLLAAAVLAPRAGAKAPDVLKSVGGVPAHVAGQFEEPFAFQQAPSGTYFVFDRRAHAVYSIDRGLTEATKIVSVGPEQGRLLGPHAFDVGPDGTFVVADAPNLVERIQFFTEGGVRTSGFSLYGKAAPRVSIGSYVLSGIGSLQYTGRSLLMCRPESGGLVTEYWLSGVPFRTFGNLRQTGQEHDREVHWALNTGLPLANPRGGYYFVFLTGQPRFRKYDKDGTLVFERIVQGREIDAVNASIPTVWPRREVGGQTLPLVTPTVRTAAVDPDGNLWISFVIPYTYVYDEDGDRIRSLQFAGAGIIAPTSLHFPSRGRLLVTPGLYEFRTN